MDYRFADFHPLVTFIYFAGAMMLLILMLHPIFSGAAFVVVLLLHFVYDRFQSLWKWLFLLLSSGCLILLLNPLFNERGRHLLFVVGGHRITLEAVVYGGVSALSIMAVIALFVSYNDVMTPNKLLYLFSKVLPQFAVLLMLTLRFIPLMRRRLEEISAVQASKGMSVVHGNWRRRAHVGLQYVQVLLTFSLEEAIQTADSMKARGYGEGKRTSYDYFVLNKSDLAGLLIVVGGFAFVMLGRARGNGHLVIYPMMEKISLSSGREYIVLAVYVLFLGFPLLTEIGGKIRWKLFN